MADAAETVDGTRKKEPSVFSRIFHFAASFGVAVVVLFFLLILTWLGTLEQAEVGLYDTQKKYFDSLFLVHKAFNKYPIPLPGVYLLMAILFVNLLCGGILRIRKSWRTPGVITSHLAMLLMIAAGGVSYHYKTEGYMQIWPDEESRVFHSYHEWSVEVRELVDSGSDRIWTIPEKLFVDRGGDKTRAFTHPELPFALNLSGYERNALVLPEGQVDEKIEAKVVDGYFIRPDEVKKENEQNQAAVVASLEGSDGTTIKETILWGLSDYAWPRIYGLPLVAEALDVGGRKFVLGMVRQKYEAPVKVTLKEFFHELHPRTNKPSRFQSDVSWTDGEDREEFSVKMNQPLRQEGHVFFQTKWGPPNATMRDKKYTVFAVVSNPSDKWPEISCYIVLVGLAFHFTQKLYLYLTRQRKLKTPVKEKSA